MVLDIIIPFLAELIKDPIKKYVVTPIKRHYSYAFKPDSKVQELQEQVEQLKNKTERLKQSVVEATRNGEEIFPNVTEWLRTADKEVGEADSIIKRKEDVKNKCFFGLSLKFNTRYQLGKNAELKATEIQKLCNKEGLDQISYRPLLQQITHFPSGSDEPLPSRASMLNQIMDALKDPNLNMIGVWGMGGIGKTTLAYEVQAKALQDKLFEIVVVVPVSQTPELRRIQGEIAFFLGLKFDAEEISGRASQLYNRLKKSSILIILDDLWKKLDLVAVGIPVKIPSQKETSKGFCCKIMLTSRRMDLLSREMGAQRLFPLEALNEEETLSLFMSAAEPSNNLHSIATKIAKKCAGLPLLIQIVAAGLKNKESHVWNDTLNQLSTYDNEDLYDKVYKVIESSYDNLPGNEIKSFFLVCALFGQSNIWIQYLLTYCMGLGLFKHIRTIEGARDRVFTLIDKLKANSLLLDEDMVGFARMHDVVRDTARNIASRSEQHAFFGTGEFSSMDWPDKDCTRISLTLDGVSELPDMDCPKAEILLLFTEDLSLKIPDSFFNGNNNLKVVELTGIRMMSLPSSIGLLTSLKTLCLNMCRLDNVAVLGELKQLEMLTIEDSKIVELAREIEALTRLKLLDLRDCSNLQVIPAGVLSKLLSLEELYMLNSFMRWDAKGNASLMELESLSHLLTLEIEIVDPKRIPIGFKCFSRLRRYKISIGHEWDWNGQYKRSRTLKFEVEAGFGLVDHIKSLLKETEDLYLDGVMGIESVLFYESFPKLKHMHVDNDFGIQHLIKSSMQTSFPELESLYLKKLQSMEKICSGELRMGSFGKLQILNINNCDKMKSLFSFSSLKCLQQLQELEVVDCKNMEVVFGEGINEDEVIELTHLSSLKLWRLPHLIGFYKIKEETEQMGQTLFNKMVCFPNLTSLDIYRCKSLKRIFTPSMVKCLMQLKNLEISDCKLVEEIIESKKMEEIKEEEEDSRRKIVFPKLDTLTLRNLKKVKRFSGLYSIEFPLVRELRISYCEAMRNFVGKVPCNESEESLFNEMVCFPNLTSLEVYGCNSLKYIFTASMLNCLMQLTNLQITECELVEEIIESKKMEEIEEEKSTQTIVLPKLERLFLHTLRNLKRFGSWYSIEFPLLIELSLYSCRAMGNFVGRDSSSESEKEGYLFNEMATFSYLEILKISSMDSIKGIWDDQFIGGDSFFKLKSIQISECSKLSVVFPSKICTRFQRLETLSLSNCDRVQEIYQRNMNEGMRDAFSLRDLNIYNLPSLKDIWNKDSEWRVFSSFQNLHSVVVGSCENLKYVFPASVGCGLFQLQNLNLEDCKKLEVMIAKEKDEETSHPSFLFPELTCMKLKGLQEMKRLYEGGSHTFNFPELKSLKIEHCSSISIEKFIFNCEEMIIDEQSFHAIHQSTDFSVELCTKLKKVTLLSFHEETSTATVSGFLSGIKSLEMLVLDSCSLEEITALEGTLNQSPNGDEQRNLLRVKHLNLQSIHKLEHIMKKDSQHLQHLQTLNLESCYDLMSISPSSTCLLSLTTLHLSSCNNLTKLVTASTAKTMVHLIDMKVEFCTRIEEIVSMDAEDAEHGEITFNKLQYLKLNWLPNFNSFCSTKYNFSFPLLEQVVIKGCSRMNIFCGGAISTPKLRGILFEGEQQWEGNLNDTVSSQLRTWVGEHLDEGRLFQNLESLELVNNTVSSKAILTNQMQFLIKLRKIIVRDCDSIQVVFDLEGDVELVLPKLNELELINLPMLSQLCSKAPKGVLDFNKLKVLKINNCSKLEYAFTWSMASCLSELERLQVTNCEMMETLIVDEKDVAEQVRFNKLKFVLLVNMPKFSNIYSGSSDLECPRLKEVTTRECPSIKALFISTHITGRVFPKLITLSTDIKSIRGMMQSEAPTNLFSNLKILEVTHCSSTTRSHAFRVHFLSRLPNLDQLKLCDSSFKELFNGNTEEASTMPLIKSLILKNLYDLNKIWLHYSLVQSLETLEVYGCNKLMNLITPSMARNMVQLRRLIVSDCKMLIEIVGHGSDQTTNEVVFTNLKTVKLTGLHSLQAFSLTCYDFKFPCLDKVRLRECPNMRIFCHGTINTPMLNCVQGRESFWEGDLNITITQMNQKMEAFGYIEEIKLSAFPVLKEKWEARLPISFLYSVERLEVDNCELYSNAIPSQLLQFLRGLKILIVENCVSVEQVINLEGLNANEFGINEMENLEELVLIDLPRLKQVWSKDPQQILSFKNLQYLQVHNCGSLTFILSLSMALSLQNLQHLEVKNCSLVKHIIMIEEEETVQKYQIVLPTLQSMALLHLTDLLSFCSTSGILECLGLNMIKVVDCPKMDLCASIEDPDSVALFLGNKIVTYGMEEITVEWKTLKDEIIGNYQLELFSMLKCIELTGFQDEEYMIFPPTFLRHFPELEMLVLCDSLIEEINFDYLRIVNDKYPDSVPSLTMLKLSNLPELKHFVCHDSQLVPLFQNLAYIEIVDCGSLEILVPPSVAFHNLTDLLVSKCDGLINLISASTARSLVQLRRMVLKDCKMIQDIVGIGLDGEEYEIRFSQLEYLELDGLQCITCFSSGNYSFGFPSLQEVLITECPNMKKFAEQVSVNPNLRKIETGRQEYDWEWEGSLNETIQDLYLEKDVEEKDAQNMPREEIE